MKTVWLLLSLVGLSLAASLGDVEPSGLIGRRELRRPALLLEAQRLNHGAAARRQGVLFKTLSNFGGRRRLSAPPGSDVAPPSDPTSTESGSDDAVASLINRFGGVIQQKRRLGDDDAVSEDGDDLVARSSSTKNPVDDIGGDGKSSGSDSGPAWTPTYGGTYVPEPQLQSNYKALLSEPEFGPSGTPGESYAAVVGGTTVSAQAFGPASGSSGNKEQGALDQSTNADGQPAAKSGDSKDCKDKDVKKNEEGVSKPGDGVPGMSEPVAVAGVPAKTGASGAPHVSSKQGSTAGKHGFTTGDIEYVDDDDDYEEDQEHEETGDANKKGGTASSHEDGKTPSAAVATGAETGGGVSNLPTNGNDFVGSTTGAQPPQIVGSGPTTGISTAAKVGAVQESIATAPGSENVEGSPVRAEIPGQNLEGSAVVQVSPASGEALSSAITQVTQNDQAAQAPSSTEEGLGQSPALPQKDVSDSAGSHSENGGESSGRDVQNAGASPSVQVNAERGPDVAKQAPEQHDSTNPPDAEVFVGPAISASIKEVPLGNDDAVEEEPHTTPDSKTLQEASRHDSDGSTRNTATGVIKAGESPEDSKDNITGSDAKDKEYKSISNAQPAPATNQEGQPGIAQGEEQLNVTIASLEAPASMPNLGREEPVVNGISRAAAEAEILTFLKQRASKQDATIKSNSPQQIATVGATASGQDGTVVSGVGGVDTSRGDQHRGPTLFSQNNGAVLQPPASSINTHTQSPHPESGLPAQTPNLPLPGSHVFSPGTVPGSGISGYAIPLEPGVYYPVGVSGSHDVSGSVFAQGSFPADTAGFVAETPAVVPPSVTSESNATVSAAPPVNGSEENASSKPTDQGAAAEAPEKTPNDLGTYTPASSLGGPIAGGESKNTAPNVEDAASTSFIAGTDSLSTEKEKKLAVNDLEEPAGGSMERGGFQAISINVTDTQTPIDVSGIVMTPGDIDGSAPPLSKPATTITDSTKTVVVEGGSSDSPIDVSGIATSSETPTEDKDSPSEAPKEAEAANDSLKPVQNETALSSASTAGDAKTKDDCKDDDTKPATEKSPHGKPVVFENSADPTSSLQATDKNNQQNNVINGVNETAVPQSDAVAIQSDAPTSASAVTSTAEESTLNVGEAAVKDTNGEAKNRSQDTGVGYVVGTKLTFSVDEKTPTSSAPPMTEAATVSPSLVEAKDGSLTSSTAMTNVEVTTPSPQAESEQQDARELGGADVPEPPRRNLDNPSEKSIAAVVSDMMTSNETSQAEMPLPDHGSNAQTVNAKYTPLPISSVTISDVGPSTATLPALGYATVREIQIATHQELDPKLSSASSSDSVPGAEEQVDGRSLKKAEGSEGVASGIVPASPLPPNEVMQSVATTPTPISDVVSTTIKYTTQDTNDMEPEAVKNESLASKGLPTEASSTPESTSAVPEPAQTESTAAAQSAATEAPALGITAGRGTEEPPLEKSEPGLQVVPTEPPSPSPDAVAAQVLDDSAPVLRTLPTETPPAESNASAAADQASVEGRSQPPGSSTDAPMDTFSETSVPGPVGSPDAFASKGPSTGAPSPDTSTSEANGQAVPESTRVPLGSSTVASTPSTSVDMATETTLGSTPLSTSSSTVAPPTTENPDVATVPTVTESTTATPSTTERTTPGTTEETRTLPPIHLPKRPQIKPLGGAKRPLFNIARPPSFTTTVAQRRFKPLDRVNNEGIEATPPTTAQPPLRPSTLSVGNVPAEEDLGVRIVEAPGVQFRRPHFPRPVSADRRVAPVGPGGKPPGRIAGRRRKPGSRGGHRRTTTTTPPPQEETTVPSAIEELEDTSSEQPSTTQFGARIGARVPQTSRRLLPTTQQSFNTAAPVSADRQHSRPAKPRRTKRPRLPAVARPSATESNDVRYAYTSPAFASTRVPVVKEAAYETTHGAYITEIAPASTTYRTKSPLVAEVTLPTTEDDRNYVSSEEYDEPLSDEPHLPSTPASGREPSVLATNAASLPQTFDEQLLQKEHGVDVASIAAREPTEAPESPVKTDIPASQGIEEPTTLGNEETEQPGTSLDAPSPALSTLAPTTSYGEKLTASPNPATETLNEFSKGDTEDVEQSVKFYPTRYHPQYTTKVPTTQALTEAPANPSVDTTPSQPTNPSSQTEEFLPSTPEVDIPRIPTTPAPKPTQTTTLPTTKKPYYPPLPNPPANPVAVFSEGQPGQAQNNVPDVAVPAEPGKDAETVLGVTSTSSTGSSPATAQTESSQASQVPQFTSTKRPDVSVPPSYLIPNTPDQAQAHTYRPPHKPVYVAQSSPPQTKSPAVVTSPPSNNPSTLGVTVTVPSQQSATVPSTPQAQSPQPQTTLRPLSGSTARYAQAGPGSVESSAPSLASAQPTATGERLPSAFAPSQSYQPNTLYSPPSSSYPSRPPAQQPSAGSVPPSTRPTAAPRPPPVPPAPPTRFPISTTSRPRLPPSYVPQPAYLEQLGLQVQPFIVSGGSKQQQAQPGQPQAGYAHPLGLQVSGYQPTRVQEPSAPTSLQGPAGPKAQPPSNDAAQRPKQQLQQSLAPASLATPSRPAFNYRAPVQEPHGQRKQLSSATAQERPAQPGYILPLGLQVAYIPPFQRNSASAVTSSQGAPLSVPRLPQGTQAASVKPPAPKSPQYYVVSTQQQVPRPGQAVQRPSTGVPKQATPQRVVYQTPQVSGANEQAPRAPAKVQVQSFGAPPTRQRVVYQTPQVTGVKEQATRAPAKVQVQSFGTPPTLQRAVYRRPQDTGVNEPAPRAPAKVKVQSFEAPQKVPLPTPNQPKTTSAFVPPQLTAQLGALPRPQHLRPFSQPQLPPGQKPRIGQAHTRIYFSPPVPQKQNGSKQPPLPIAPFFLSIRHDQVVQEDVPFAQIGNALTYKQTIPADIVLPPQKVARPVRPSAPSKKTNSDSETLLQIPQTPRPARVQAEKAVPSGPAAAGKKPSSPVYYTPAGQPGVVKQVPLSPATGPIPYEPQTLVPSSQTTPQQGTQGVYKVRTYVPVASASLPGKPGVTATSYVPATQNGQVVKVTSVAKPASSPTQAVVQSAQGAQGAGTRTNAASVSARQAGAVLGSSQQQTAPAAATAARGQPTPGRQILVPQGLVQAPQQQLVQVTSYVPQGSPQAQQAQGAYLSQVPVQQQSYSRSQQPSLNLQVPIVYANAQQAAPQFQYYPGATGVIGQLKQSPQQQYSQQQYAQQHYPQQQFQTVYAVPQGQITLAQVGSRASGATQGSSHPLYVANGSPALQQGTSANIGAQGYAPIVYQRPPVTLLARRPVYAYQSPVYVAASPHQLSQGAAKLTSAVSPFQQPLGLSIG